MELQQELLSTAQDCTSEQALERGRTFEASIAHMKQLADAQGTNVNAMRIFPIRKCHNCGGSHQNDTRDQCSAYGTICNNCGKPNHWGKVCRLIKQRRSKSRDRQQNRQYRPRHQSMTRRGHNGRQKGTVHSIKGQSTECMDEHFQHMSFAETKISGVDTRDEVFATLNIKLDSKLGNYTLKLKIGTGAQGNTLPLRIYRRMHPKCLMDGFDVYPRPGGIVKHQNTILTAYNGTRIEQLGVVTIPCQNSHGRWYDTKFARATVTLMSTVSVSRSRTSMQSRTSKVSSSCQRLALHVKG